ALVVGNTAGRGCPPPDEPGNGQAEHCDDDETDSWIHGWANIRDFIVAPNSSCARIRVSAANCVSLSKGRAASKSPSQFRVRTSPVFCMGKRAATAPICCACPALI